HSHCEAKRGSNEGGRRSPISGGRIRGTAALPMEIRGSVVSQGQSGLELYDWKQSRVKSGGRGCREVTRCTHQPTHCASREERAPRAACLQGVPAVFAYGRLLPSAAKRSSLEDGKVTERRVQPLALSVFLGELIMAAAWSSVRLGCLGLLVLSREQRPGHNPSKRSCCTLVGEAGASREEQMHTSVRTSCRALMHLGALTSIKMMLSTPQAAGLAVTTVFFRPPAFLLHTSLHRADFRALCLSLAITVCHATERHGNTLSSHASFHLGHDGKRSLNTSKRKHVIPLFSHSAKKAPRPPGELYSSSVDRYAEPSPHSSTYISVFLPVHWTLCLALLSSPACPGVRLSRAQYMRMPTPASEPSASSPQGGSQVLGTLSQLCHNSTACCGEEERCYWDLERSEEESSGFDAFVLLSLMDCGRGLRCNWLPAAGWRGTSSQLHSDSRCCQYTPLLRQKTGLWYSLQAGPRDQMQFNICSPTPAELQCTVISEPRAAGHCCGLR
ncbi:Phosphoenolpyruvate carboxykinase [GTP], partial [Dissostichus eleginoides]